MMVDLVARYSNQAGHLKRVNRTARMLAKGWVPHPIGPVSLPRRVDLRLSDEDVEQLVADYQAGRTGRQLAEAYGLARSTVMELLHERGVEVRHPRVTAEETLQAVAWYHAGVQQVEIAARLGREKAVVWHLLKRAGAL
jgi:hypothetical protein